MKARIFDTLEYTKGAEKVGIPREQAEYQAQEIAKLLTNELITKSDLVNASSIQKNDLSKLKSELVSEIHKNSVKMVFGLITAMAAIQALFHLINLIK